MERTATLAVSTTAVADSEVAVGSWVCDGGEAVVVASSAHAADEIMPITAITIMSRFIYHLSLSPVLNATGSLRGFNGWLHPCDYGLRWPP